MRHRSPYTDVLLRAVTEDAVTAYPHLAILRAVAVAGSDQALHALIHQCDGLVLARWWPHDRAYAVTALTEHDMRRA